MVRFCIFDLDGTLANSLQDLADSTNFALQSMGYPTHPLECYRHFVGDGIVMLMRRAAPEGVEDEVIKRLHDAFDRHYSMHCFDHTLPYEGCPELLRRLEEQGVRTAVLSNKPDEFAGEIVRRLYPQAHFSAVFGKREGYEKKPDPAALNGMIRQSGIPKEQCLYIGDSNVDVFTAHNAGIPCCGALWGFRGYQELQDAGADAFAAQPLDVLNCL